MKKLSIVLGAFLLLSVSLGNARTTKHLTNDAINKALKHEKRSEKKTVKNLNGSDGSKINKLNFNTDFGKNNDVTWTRTAYFEEATFSKDGHEMTAYYDFEGQLVGTTTYKTFADLPAYGQKYITKKYSDYAIGSVLFYNYNGAKDIDKVLYGSQFGNADNYFVELTKGDNKIMLQVDPVGVVTFFKQLK